MSRFSLLSLFICCACVAPLRGQDKPPAGVDPAKALADMQQQFLLQFDVNKDGKLSDQEKLMAQEAMRLHGINMGIAPGGFPGSDQFVKQFDVDRDGKLSPQEAMMAQAVFQRMRNNGSGVRTGVRPNIGGGGGSIPQQQPALPAAQPAAQKGSKVSPLVKRFDKDGDGKLNAGEKAAAQAELKGKDKAKDAKTKEKGAKKDK
jgi:EF hand